MAFSLSGRLSVSTATPISTVQISPSPVTSAPPRPQRAPALRNHVPGRFGLPSSSSPCARIWEQTMADPERLEAWPDAREKDRRLVDRMLALFDLEQVAADRFRAGGAETEPRRIFGGQFVAQALEAAVRTVAADRRAHSVHAYFLRSGVTSRDSEFLVSCDADGSNHSF